MSRYDVSKVILIGSCIDKERFHNHSDIDLCIQGLSPARYFEAVGELITEAGEFDVDLILLEDIPQDKKDYIQKGKILYEKKGIRPPVISGDLHCKLRQLPK